MTKDWLILVQLSALFIALFAMAEILYHSCMVRAEYTRKIVHTGTGLLTLLFPLCFHHLWQVVVICVAFLVLLTISMRLGFLRSVNAVIRTTSGSLLYPVIVMLVFAFYQYIQQSSLLFDGLLYFYLPVLLMAVCDPVAALAGGMYKKKHPDVAGKTWAGSFSFFVAALLMSSVLYNMFSLGIGGMMIILYSAITAFMAMAVERISNKGWDNFTIPVVVMLFLYSIELMK